MGNPEGREGVLKKWKKVEVLRKFGFLLFGVTVLELTVNGIQMLPKINAKNQRKDILTEELAIKINKINPLYKPGKKTKNKLAIFSLLLIWDVSLVNYSFSFWI